MVCLKNIFIYRELILALAAKEIKIKYKSAVLGWLWSILNPLLLMIILSLVFTFIFKLNIENPPIFLLSALLPWFFLNFSVSGTVGSIVENSSLLKKAYFPYEAIPISIVVANFINFLISISLLLIFLLFFGIYPSVNFLFLPLIVMLEFTFVLGVCLMVSALHAIFRDVRYAVELLLIVWFYASPIFYPISWVPNNLRWIYYLNPMSLFITFYRDILLYQRNLDVFLIAWATFLSTLSLILGNLIFSYNKKYFVDVT